MNDDAVTDRKKAFPHKFDTTVEGVDWQFKALGDGVISAIQRNPTYTPGTTFSERERFRESWKNELTMIAREYVTRVKSRKGYETDVLKLQKRMNDRFGPILQTKTSRCEPGFRVSHAQKSLSLVLKHYWCHSRIEEPPACPVDRLILTVADAPFWSRTWTSVNTIEEYRLQIGILDQAAADAGQSVAVWELLNFK